MRQASSGLPAERKLQLENELLTEVIRRDRITQEELVRRMEGAGTDRIAILDSLQELKRSGLVRFLGEVIEPTFAALRAAEVFEVI